MTNDVDARLADLDRIDQDQALLEQQPVSRKTLALRRLAVRQRRAVEQRLRQAWPALGPVERAQVLDHFRRRCKTDHPGRPYSVVCASCHPAGTVRPDLRPYLKMLRGGRPLAGVAYESPAGHRLATMTW